VTLASRAKRTLVSLPSVRPSARPGPWHHFRHAQDLTTFGITYLRLREFRARALRHTEVVRSTALARYARAWHATWCRCVIRHVVFRHCRQTINAAQYASKHFFFFFFFDKDRAIWIRSPIPSDVCVMDKIRKIFLRKDFLHGTPNGTRSLYSRIIRTMTT